jgi:hypothetical protein
MAIDSPPADGPPKASGVLAAPGWPWRRAALFVAGAAPLSTIAAPVGADPIATTWWSLLSAAAPGHPAGQRAERCLVLAG